MPTTVIMSVIMDANDCYNECYNKSVRLLGIFPNQTREEITKQGRNKSVRLLDIFPTRSGKKQQTGKK